MARNPFAFRASPVAFWTSLIYLLLGTVLVYIHESVPPPPSRPDVYRGLNLTQAWLDLTTITKSYHPYNSRANDQVRNYILSRIAQTLDANRVNWATAEIGGTRNAGHYSSSSSSSVSIPPSNRRIDDPAVIIFNDIISNVTMTPPQGRIGTNLGDESCAEGTYFEGSNVIVYIRGKLDPPGAWWESAQNPPIGKGGLLINAHFDSVSTGFGATDDGMGVVTSLQMIGFHTAQRTPDHGIVVLFNNGEEDGLHGARAFSQSPLKDFCHTFINLEGAGAGGRAMLFRTTDREVTQAYSSSPHPFGSVIASDGFGLGLIRSATDYSVFHDIYGQRGADIAFYRPRARYHTNQDDMKHTSRASVWHMISAAIAMSEKLSGDTGDTFLGPRPDDERDKTKVSNGIGSDGVWFDIFGKIFVIFSLRHMFAWSLTLLIASPLILLVLTYILIRSDQYYFFTASVKVQGENDEDKVDIGGWKGFMRFPFALIFSGSLVLGAAFLVRKFNPFIIYSSEYAVWAMMISLFYMAFWTIMRGANFVRPSALHRGYVHIWLFALVWAIMVPITVFEDRFHLGFGYPFVVLLSAIFLSTFIALCELFALPKKESYARQALDDHQIREYLQVTVPSAEALIAPSPGEIEHAHPEPEVAEAEAEEEPEPTETTPLRGGANSSGDNARTTFATAYRRSISSILRESENRVKDEPFEYEQAWSGKLPSWTWFLQLLLLAPITFVIFGQPALFLVSSISGTGVDGSNTLLPYLMVAVFSIMVLLPITPFIHRLSWQLPISLFFIFLGTLAYNLVAFPFSADNRYKAFFQQALDLDTGSTVVKIRGIEPYPQMIIAELPSAAGKAVVCHEGPLTGMTTCEYDGSAVPPNLGGSLPDGIPPEKNYADLISVNVSWPDSGVNKATLQIDANNTKACVLTFSQPLDSFEVQGGADRDPVFGKYPDHGVCRLTLWRRDPSKAWTVDITWADEEPDSEPGLTLEVEPPSSNGDPADSDELKRRQMWSGLTAHQRSARSFGLHGKCICYWSDVNDKGTIPAFDEALQYSPVWVGITKSSAAIVEGSKSFKV